MQKSATTKNRYEIQDIPHITKFLSLAGIFLMGGMMIVNLSKSGYRTYFYYDNPTETYAKIVFVILLVVFVAIAVKSWKVGKYA